MTWVGLAELHEPFKSTVFSPAGGRGKVRYSEHWEDSTHCHRLGGEGQQ